ncbi:hypothetical protein ETB97_002028 [Aspergillus alliaceus]|uniref:Uncharacterized protein n=1 Tax=Petromyces alliaceus TaxID=209559 RepID=A0A8H6A3V0_PETAA|nr:hypothetical protein ETB97_002028 [Aspergillus burnettii]
MSKAIHENVLARSELLPSTEVAQRVRFALKLGKGLWEKTNVDFECERMQQEEDKDPSAQVWGG